jgi:hypothetical protein
MKVRMRSLSGCSESTSFLPATGLGILDAALAMAGILRQPCGQGKWLSKRDKLW